jgi:hypothetical protein
MADMTVRVPQGYPVGTTLSVYVDRVGDIVPQGTPVSTCVIGSDSMVTITGITPLIPYQVGAVIAGRWRGFLVEMGLPLPTDLSGVIAELAAHEADATDVHGTTGTLASDAEVAAAIAALRQGHQVEQDGGSPLTQRGVLNVIGPLLAFDDSIGGTTNLSLASSPAFLGNPTAPTQSAGDNSTKLATTAYADRIAQGVGSPNTQTGNYTLALADAGKTVEANSASAIVVTVPTNASVAFPIGTIIEVSRLGAGTVTLAAAGGVTIRSRGSLLAVGNQYGTVSLRKRATDEWVLVGDLA